MSDPATDDSLTLHPPAISVIMPVYNGMAFLDRSLRSLTAQTFPRWEVLAVDDASTDDSVGLLERRAAADPRVRVLRLPRNQGAGAARNHALRQARADAIAYLDQDDEFLPDYLARVHAHLGGCDVLVHAYEIVYPPQRPGGPERVELWDPAAAWGRVLWETIAVPLGVAHRRSLLDRAGPFCEARNIDEDGDLWRRFALGGASFLFVQSKSGRYHYRSDSLSRSRNPAETRASSPER